MYTNIFLRASDNAGHIATGNVFAVEPSTDADHDGMPDAWELRYFGSTDARPLDDPDGDGLNNLEEFHAGTDPTDAASVVTIRSIKQRGTDVVIRFASVGGKAYRLERNADLKSTAWVAVTGNLPGTGEVMEVVDSGAAGRSSYFYRLRIAP